MEHNYLKYYKPSFLIGLIIVFALLILAAKDYWGLSVSVLSGVSLCLVGISTYLWNFNLFNWLFWIDDFSGRYEGVLRYEFRNEAGESQSGELKHVKLINQTGYRITVTSFTIKEDGTKSTLSCSKGMHVEKTEDEMHFRLIYNYLNAGCIEQKFPPHFGTDELKFVKKSDGSKYLFGQYYTNRNPQTRGEYLNLKWVGNNLEHEF